MTTVAVYLFCCLLGVAVSERSNKYMPECADDNVPCRSTYYDMTTSGRGEDTPPKQPGCQCLGSSGCPMRQNYSRPSPTTTTLQIKLGGYDTLVEYNFCQAVPLPSRVCAGDEIAAVFSGRGVMANKRQRVNCLCAEDGPLFPLEATTTVGRRLTRTYSCGMKVCGPSEACNLVVDNSRARTPSSWRNLCVCPEGRQCNARIMRAVPQGYRGKGYCEKPGLFTVEFP